MGLLTGGAAGLFGEILGPLYVDARLRRLGTTYGEGGKLRRTSVPLDCLVQIDRCTERMAGTEGYTDTDQAIYILSAPPAPLESPGDVNTDCEVEVLAGPYAGAVFKLASPIDRDPGAAYWLARGTRAKGTTGG